MHRRYSVARTSILASILALSLVACSSDTPAPVPSVDNSVAQAEQDAPVPQAPSDIRADVTLPQNPEYLAQYESFKQAVAPHMTTEAGGTSAQYYVDSAVLVIKDAEGADLAILTAEEMGITSPEKVESMYAKTVRSGRALRTTMVMDGQEFAEVQPNT